MGSLFLCRFLGRAVQFDSGKQQLPGCIETNPVKVATNRQETATNRAALHAFKKQALVSLKFTKRVWGRAVYWGA